MYFRNLWHLHRYQWFHIFKQKNPFFKGTFTCVTIYKGSAVVVKSMGLYPFILLQATFLVDSEILKIDDAMENQYIFILLFV